MPASCRSLTDLESFMNVCVCDIDSSVVEQRPREGGHLSTLLLKIYLEKIY